MKKLNPKDNFGTKKAPLSTIPCPVLVELGVAMHEGALKYGRHNYRAVAIRYSVYYDAVMRHMMAWYEGEDIDVESGLSHVTKAIATLVVLRDAMMQGNFNDDRPIKSLPWLPQLNEAAKKLSEKFPEPVAPFTELDINGVKIE